MGDDADTDDDSLKLAVTIPCRPEPVAIDPNTTALLIIDMQRDFLLEGGFGAALGNDVSKLQRAIEPCKAVLEACRRTTGGGSSCISLIVHTREGHRPEL